MEIGSPGPLKGKEQRSVHLSVCSVTSQHVILVRVCEPVFLNLPQSYTWPSKNMTYSYT